MTKSLKEVSLGGDDVREGLTAVISVKLPDPQFEGQTKTKLGNSEVKGIVEALVNDKLGIYLEEHPSEAKRVALKGIEAARVRAGVRTRAAVCGIAICAAIAFTLSCARTPVAKPFPSRFAAAESPRSSGVIRIAARGRTNRRPWDAVMARAVPFIAPQQR